jgi:hypothetical protein
MNMRMSFWFYYSRGSGRVTVTDADKVLEIVEEMPTYQKQKRPDGTLSLTVTDLTKVMARYVPMGYTIHVEQVT